MGDRFSTVILVLIVGALGGLGWLFWSIHDRDVNAPCSEFASFPVGSLPVRCLQYFNVHTVEPAPSQPKDPR